jgi:hypothetical protein
MCENVVQNQIFEEDWPQDVILGAFWSKMDAAGGIPGPAEI